MMTGTFFSGRNCQNQKLTQQHNPPDRRLELFFSGRNRQNYDRKKKCQSTVSFFSSCNNDRAPARQTTVSFFSGRNKNFLPQQKTCQFPARTKNWHNSRTRQTDDYRLVWATLKTIASSAILDLWKFLSYRFTGEPPCYFGINRKLMKRPS